MYWMKTFGSLFLTKGYFDTYEDVKKFLKDTIRKSTESRREQDLKILEERKKHMAPKDFEYRLKEIKNWKGFEEKEVLSCIVLIKMEKRNEEWFRQGIV